MLPGAWMTSFWLVLFHQRFGSRARQCRQLQAWKCHQPEELCCPPSRSHPFPSSSCRCPSSSSSSLSSPSSTPCLLLPLPIVAAIDVAFTFSKAFALNFKSISLAHRWPPLHPQHVEKVVPCRLSVFSLLVRLTRPLLLFTPPVVSQF